MRQVEAKKAVPKDEQLLQGGEQNPYQMQAPGGGGGTAASSSDGTGGKSRKIFVGGLAPAVDEAALRQYFEAFGVVDDAVVMYDHDNKRPRGFGFVTFAAEESLELVFARGSMQSIADKQIEIKSAVPRDQMPPAARPQPNGYFDPRFGMPGPGQRNGGGGGAYPGGYAPGMAAQFGSLPQRGGYGGPRNYAPTVQQQQQRPQRYSDGVGGIPPGFQQQQAGAGAGARQQPQNMSNGGGMPPRMPPGFDMYGGGGGLAGAGAGMFGPNSQAALAYNLASLQQQAQAHLNGMQPSAAVAAGGVPGGAGAAAYGLHLKFLQAGLPSFTGTGADGGVGYGGAEQEGAEVDYAEAAAAAAAGLAAGDYGNNFHHDVGQYGTTQPPWATS